MGDTRWTRKRLAAMALLGLLAVLALLAFAGNTSGADYIGSATCGNTGCHKGTYEDWQETLHGTDFAHDWYRGGVLTNKYTMSGGNTTTGAFGSCANCHVVGWGDTDHGGTIPTEPWNSTHNEPLGSIGCENCHGPGSDHADDRAGTPEYMDPGEFAYSLSCAGWSTVSNTERPGFDGTAACHDGYRMGGIPADDVPGYYESAHASGIGSSSPKGRTACYHCMAADGFISVTIEGNPPPSEITQVGDDYFVNGEKVVYGIYCLACHDPHPDKDEEEIEFQLRAPADEICELCHYSTSSFPSSHITHPTAPFRHGQNGQDVPVMTYMDEVSCPECHMWASAGHGDPPVKVGHSFQWAPQACVACHSMYTNESAEAYVEEIHADFNAWVAKFGTEEAGLLFEVEERMVWAMDNDLWTEDTNTTYWEAFWNYEYPVADGSMGAHNPGFMEAMFESAMEKYEAVLAATDMGGVGGALTWTEGGAIEGAKIVDGTGATKATTDAEGKYFFWADSGAMSFFVQDADGNWLGSIDATVTTMQNVTKDVSFEKVSAGGGEEDEETDTMTYVFIGIIVLLIIILIVVAMMGGKKKE